MKRRKFIINNTKAALGISLIPTSNFSFLDYPEHNSFVSKRPPLESRSFVSEAVEDLIKKVKAGISDPELAWMFENCYPNTLDTTVDFEVIDGKPDSFIITGDIDAMWLRDSTAQVWPYMPLIKKDDKIKNLVLG
ncbi:glycoside hydrolase family 125 protein [Flavobacteriaceae bacterium]|nr:glycoside hydrolase family 125 protein [Flavobacteriaceae bacterium]